MSDFKNFVKAVKTSNSEVALLASKISDVLAVNTFGSSVLNSLSSSEKEKFATKVSELTHSDMFLTELSNDIGLPTENESKDEFVDRAKKTMKGLLLRKLSK